jgi:hypothetical protein
MTHLNLLFCKLSRVKTTYEAVFGHTVPSDFHDIDTDWLVWRLHKAIQDWEPVQEFGFNALNHTRHPQALETPLPLERRALIRWRYLTGR